MGDSLLLCAASGFWFASRLWYVVCAIWRTHIWVQYDAPTYECDMTHSHMSTTWRTHIWMRHDAPTYEYNMTHPHISTTWRTHIWMRHAFACICVRNKIHMCVRQNSFVSATWLICVRHDSFECDMTHLSAFECNMTNLSDAFACAT